MTSHPSGLEAHGAAGCSSGVPLPAVGVPTAMLGAPAWPGVETPNMTGLAPALIGATGLPLVTPEEELAAVLQQPALVSGVAGLDTINKMFQRQVRPPPPPPPLPRP